MHKYPLYSQPSPVTGGLPLAKTVTVIALAMTLASAARAATASFSTNPPAAGPIIISNLVGHVAYDGTGTDPGPQSNVDDPKYVAYDQPAQGQTFTTGSDPNGYKVVAVTLKQVDYGSAVSFSLVPTMNYTIRITRPLTASTLSVIASENAVVPEDYTDCSTCNFPTIGGGAAKTAGTGRYITFTFATPVALAPNTLYGFDVSVGHTPTHYWETDGRDSTPPPHGTTWTPVDPYAGGNAYNSGPNLGSGDTTITNRAGDRVFVVALTLGNVVTPPSVTRQPLPAALYAGRTAQFVAQAAGTAPLVYRWRKDGANLSDGGRISGALTDTLTVSNVTAGDVGSYTLLVTNSAGAATSAPPASLAVVAAPAPSASYMYAVFTNNAFAHWRLNELADPSTNPPAYDYIGGRIGTYGTASLNGFNAIAGPRPSAFPGFESGNSAAKSTYFTDQSWVTVPPLDLDTNTVTLTAWIYPIGAQDEFTGFILTDSGASRAGMAYGDHFTSPSGVGQLTYTWNNNAIRAFPSGLTIPSDQWSFIGLVITPTSGTLYLGSGGILNNAVNAVPHLSERWDGPSWIGYDHLFSPQRVLNGIVDELAVFKRSLSLDEMNTLYNIGRGVFQAVPPTFAGAPPSPQALYAGRTARFSAPATGSAPLVYHWRKNGTNINDGGNISGTLTDSLTVSNIAAADQGAYTLVVTNSVGAITSAPPATLTIVAPSGKDYEAAVRSANPYAYWRLNESGDPSTNTPAFDYWGGFVGKYESNALNGFNLIAGPQPAGFSGFEANNNALELDTSGILHSYAWVTVPALNLNTNTVTITLWLKPATVPVNDFAGLFFTHEGSAEAQGCGLRYTTNNTLSYVWNFAAIRFDTDLSPPAGQWSFAALVIEPTKGTIYLYNANGQASTNIAVANIAEAWDGNALIGYDGGFFNADFPGDIDDVAVFNYAFTPAQVLSLYNAAVGAAPTVTLTIQKVGSNVQLTWPQGTLLEANDLTGPWTTNAAAVSPYPVTPTAGKKFYRILAQ